MLDPTTTPPSADLSATDQVLTLQAELRRVIEARDEFMVGMNHRIRTPLSGVLGMLELLAAYDLPEEQQAQADSALASGNSLVRVLEELHDFCCAQAGELMLQSESFSPSQVAADVMSTFAQAAGEKGLQLTTSISPEVPATIEGDPRRLQQVLYELVENALRSTAEGRVQVGIRTVAGDGALGRLLFWVEDTGQGICEDQLSELFEFSFDVKGDDPLTLGLPAAAQIVAAMGGRIDAESQLGHGSTVRFTLPVAPPWSQAPRASSGLAPEFALSHDGDRRSARVMVVEDDPVNQRVTLGFIKLAGFEGVVVSSGEEALETLAKEDVDLVLMDKMMPGMDGLETTRAIREGREGVRNSNTPIIALTAEVSVEARRECFAAGMNDFLTKPIRKGEIAPVIRAWLPPHLRPPFKGNAA